MRKAEKQYYNKLAECEQDMKKTWCVLNKLTGKNKQKSTQCEFIIENTQWKNYCYALNDFYINVGPSLADKINCDNVTLYYDDFLKEINCEKIHVCYTYKWREST